MDRFWSIDIGNSTVVIGRFEGDEVGELWRLSSQTGRTEDEIALLLRSLAGWERVEPPTGVAIASVVPTLTEPFRAGAQRVFGLDPLVVTHDLDLGLEIHYADPSQIGPDRLANAVGVKAHHRCPAIVVDLGTTTNFDVVGSDGAFEGGSIAPGYLSSADSVFRRAARLPTVELSRRPPRAIGRTTEEAIQSGVLFGTVGQIDAIVTRIMGEMDETPLVIGTGGLARIIESLSTTIEAVDGALTLKGIREIARRNPR